MPRTRRQSFRAPPPPPMMMVVDVEELVVVVCACAPETASRSHPVRMIAGAGRTEGS
jgi:hypothetical protein